MAMPDGPAAFMSYVRFNDQHDDGQLSQFRERLAAEVRAQTGQGFAIFQDRNDIAWGQNWQQRIDETLDEVTLLLVIITPSLFLSPPCRAEVTRFLDRERALGRADLIMPVYYISARQLDDLALREADEIATVLASRQFADWRELGSSRSPPRWSARPSRSWHPGCGTHSGSRPPPRYARPDVGRCPGQRPAQPNSPTPVAGSRPRPSRRPTWWMPTSEETSPR